MNGCVECVQEQVSHLEQISSDILYLFFSDLLPNKSVKCAYRASMKKSKLTKKISSCYCC